MTRIDFSVSPEYGFSGRVSDLDNIPLAAVPIEVLTESSFVLQSALTDRFGLYRFDGLPPNRYELRLDPDFAERYGMPKASRWVKLDDDFLFDQNLMVPTRSHGHIRGRAVAQIPRGYDAYVTIDGKRLARVHGEGEFYIGGLQPGSYTIALAIEKPDSKDLVPISHQWRASVRKDHGTWVDVASEQRLVASTLGPQTLDALVATLAGP